MVLSFFTQSDYHKMDCFTPKELVDGIYRMRPDLKNDPNMNNDIGRCIAKLEKDGYIDVFKVTVGNDPTLVKAAQISFNGLVFMERGGYGGEVLRSRQVEIRNNNAYTLNCILAVGVTTPFFWYLLDLIRLYRNSWFDLSKIFSLSFVSACIGAILWHLLSLINSRSKNNQKIINTRSAKQYKLML